MSATLSTTSRVSKQAGTPLDDHRKLDAFRILVDKDAEKPSDLQAHVKHNIFRHRAAVSSENAKVIVQRRKLVLERNEPSCIRLVEPLMLSFTRLSRFDDERVGMVGG